MNFQQKTLLICMSLTFIIGGANHLYTKMHPHPPINSFPSNDYDQDIIVSKIMESFPGALREEHFIQQLYDVLHAYSSLFGDNTLLATSFCCDEINRKFENNLANKFGGLIFTFGGLAGFPFGGLTGFGAFAHHIPSPHGTGLIIYGPHIGIDNNGLIGIINRKGLEKSGTCCGSALAALNKFNTNSELTMLREELSLDYQQNEVIRCLYCPTASEKLLSREKNQLIELPKILFTAQQKNINEIIKNGCNNLPENSLIAVVGGIHINTPIGMSDFFLPLSFDIRDSQGNLIKNLLSYTI